jgi:hypothetical protein
MLPDPGCYEEHYRLTGHAALGLALGLISVGFGVLFEEPALSAASVILAIPVVFSAFGVILAMPGVIAMARRRIAFRADPTGITLGTVPDNMPALRHPAVFVPWAEIERVILYLARPAGPRGRGCAQVTRIAVERRAGPAEFARASKLIPGCPEPATTLRPTRRVTGWRLNRERLAAVSAAVAPEIPIVEASMEVSPDADRRGLSARPPPMRSGGAEVVSLGFGTVR